MANRPPFTALLQEKWAENKFVCVGLDQSSYEANKKIIDATYDLVCAYKPNSAFYEAEGVEGLKALKKTVDHIRQKDLQIPIILDAKRGDIGNTNEGYAKAIFDDLGFDGVTVSPYLGEESLRPFLERKDRGIIVLAKTSNPGAGEFQDLKVGGKPLYQIVAEHVALWNKNGNCGVVVGATYPKELATVRQIIGDNLPILIPGIGAQGGDLETTVKAGQDSRGQGIIINSSRGIIFADDPREATLKLHQEIVSCLK